MKQFVIAVAALWGFLALCLPVGVRAQAPVTVHPPSGQAGTRFSFLADGFRGGERIDIWLNLPDGRAIPARPDSEAQRRAAPDGRAAWSWTAPDDAPPGAWSLVARGQRSGVVRVALLTIVSPPSPDAPAAGVYPATGAPGTRFVFFAAGFDPADPLAFFLASPDGRETLVSVDQPRASNGRVDWNWTAPDNAPPGTWRFRVVGSTSKFEQTIAISINQRRAAPVGVTPGTGRPGSLFHFYADGLSDREPVIFWLNRPDGRVEPAEAERFSIGGGRVDWSWLAPDDALRGRWSMVVRGTDSGVERLIAFEIR